MKKEEYLALQSTVNKDDFETYYRNHPNREVLDHYNLSDFYLNKLLDYFCIARKTKEEINSLIKKCLLEKSPEEKSKIELQRQETRNKWTEEYRNETFGKISKAKQNRTEEQKQEQYSKFRNTLLNKSDEEKEVTHQRRKSATERIWLSKTAEEKQEFSRKMSDVYQSFSKEKKNSRVERIQNTRKELGIISCFSDATVRERIKNTNLEKYNVPYYCMTKDCRSAKGGNSALSKPNLSFRDILSSNNIDYEFEFPLGNYSYDFKVGKNLIEINPSATHNSTYSYYGDKYIKTNLYHYEKSKFARDNGYRCICVWDWDDVDKIISLLKHRETVYARKCIIQEVDLSTTREYLNAYHLQGYARDEIRLGLFYEDKLVSIMTFGNPRYNKNYQYELIRYCSHYNVIGGAEKLFKYFVYNYEPLSIISYCDMSKFNGDVYFRLNFTYKNYSIGKHWYNMVIKEHITDNLLRTRGFDQLFGTSYGKGVSNEDLMLEHGFIEVYDCGQAVYEWKKKLDNIITK